jgi:hypothetical protein
VLRHNNVLGRRTSGSRLQPVNLLRIRLPRDASLACYKKRLALLPQRKVNTPRGAIIGAAISLSTRQSGWATARGQLQSSTGNIIGQNGSGVLIVAAVCGANPNFKPFLEAEFQPQPQPRT